MSSWTASGLRSGPLDMYLQSYKHRGHYVGPTQLPYPVGNAVDTMISDTEFSCKIAATLQESDLSSGFTIRVLPGTVIQAPWLKGVVMEKRSDSATATKCDDQGNGVYTALVFDASVKSEATAGTKVDNKVDGTSDSSVTTKHHTIPPHCESKTNHTKDMLVKSQDSQKTTEVSNVTLASVECPVGVRVNRDIDTLWFANFTSSEMRCQFSKLGDGRLHLVWEHWPTA